MSTAINYMQLPTKAFPDAESVFVGTDLGAPFFDTIRLSFPEPPLPGPYESITETSNQPCGGPGRPYGRCSQGVVDKTGNQYRTNYSKWTRKPNVPPTMLWLESERSAVTAAEARMVSRDLNKQPPEVSGVDIAWDIRGNFNEIAPCMVSRTTHHRLQLVDSKTRRRTLYFGTRQGERQVCLYDKAPGVVRLEVRLRRRALKRMGITTLQQLPRLRNVDFRQLFSICDLRVPAVVHEGYRRAALQYLAKHGSLDTLIRKIAPQYDVPLKSLLRPTALDATIRQMQKALIC